MNALNRLRGEREAAAFGNTERRRLPFPAQLEWRAICRHPYQV